MNVFPTKYTYMVLTILFSLTSYLSAQENTILDCGTTNSPELIDYLNSIKSQIEKYEQEFLLSKSSKTKSIKLINSIPIKAHIIRASNGSGGISVSELNDAISQLNDIYTDAYMEFFLCDGINYINNDNLCHFKKGNESSLTETNHVPGLINIYFTDYIENKKEESICGYSDNIARNDVIVINNNCATNNSSLAHEMGHFFSLIHTHGLDNTTSELVDGSNCDTDGDGICDTPADPGLTNSNVNNFCEYTGCATDANGDKYSPNTNNIMSYSRKACRTHFTPQQLARMYAFYQTTKNYLAYSEFNANFSADSNQTCDDTLTVNFKSNCGSITKWEWDIDSDGVIDYYTKEASHTYKQGTYDVTLTVSNKSKTITKTFSKFIKVGNSISNFNEGFEDSEILSDLDWTIKDVSENGYNWLLNKGETTSEETGPLLKKLSNNKINTYIYTEASGAKPGDIAEVISPCINVVNQNSALEFSYHMFGAHMGELHIDLKTDSGYINDIMSPLYGNQQVNQADDFISKTINLSAYTGQTIKIRFRAIRGTGWDSDIAIDNIFIKTIDVPISDTPLKVYPNPLNGRDLLYVKTNYTKDLLTTFQISDFEGKTFLTGTLTEQPINVSHLSSGMYLLTISNAQYKVAKKIVK